MGSTLSIFLVDYGFSKESIGLFALLGIPFSIKILWSPCIDQFNLSIFKGRERKSWVFLSLLGISFSILGMSFLNMTLLPYLILSLSLWTGCLYISGIAYELETLEEENYRQGSAYVIAGYRIGLLIAGGGALYLSSLFSWEWMLRTLAFLILSGSLLILLIPEPHKSQAILAERKARFSTYPNWGRAVFQEIFLSPLKNFLQNPQWKLFIAFILAFKFGDELLVSMEGPFYLELGYTKKELANAAKIWGMFATISGAFCLSWFVKSRHPLKLLVDISLLHAFTLLGYLLLSYTGKNVPLLYTLVAAQNFTSGMLMTAFIAFLWKICDARFSAIQYALLWSIVSFKADLLACLGGFLAATTSWNLFFGIIAATAISIAVLMKKSVPVYQMDLR